MAGFWAGVPFEGGGEGLSCYSADIAVHGSISLLILSSALFDVVGTLRPPRQSNILGRADQHRAMAGVLPGL